tara:strand:- start:72 stop:764 length:693 start_codon:yes stop_codon:yes gene_type:complete
MEKKYTGLNELLNTEVMKNYNSFIVRLCVKNVGKAENFLDFGSGIGTLSKILKNEFKINPLCVEKDNTNSKYLKERNLRYMKDLDLCPKELDVIFSSNVLEHIEDDAKTLSQLSIHLKKGGKLFLYLPANMILWTEMDANVGHYRRYDIAELKGKCESAGFKIVKSHYSDCLGFLILLTIKYFKLDSFNTISSRKSLYFYDRFIFPISYILDNMGLKYLFGKNIVLIAEK